MSKLTPSEKLAVRDAEKYIETSNFSSRCRTAKLLAIIKRLDERETEDAL